MSKMISELIAMVRTYADNNAGASGFAMTAIDGVHIMRRFEPSETLRAVYRPVLCLVLQGTKQVTAGGKMLEFTAGQSFIVSVDMPVMGCITQADRDFPYLALSLDLDMGLMHDIVVELKDAVVSHPKGKDSVFIDETDDAVIDCAFRLMRLLGSVDKRSFQTGLDVIQRWSLWRPVDAWRPDGRGMGDHWWPAAA